MIGEEEDEHANEIIEKIQIYIYPRRVRMRDFFHDFDPLHCGRCTKAQFARALNCIAMKPPLTDAEIDVLCEHFRQQGPNVSKPQHVNYTRFTEAVDTVFFQGTTDTELRVSPGSTMLSTFVPQSIADEDQVQHILHRMAALCVTRGISFRNSFSDFANASSANPSRPNPRRGGKVTEQQFRRFFPFPKEFGGSELNILIERYRTKTGDIHFQALHNDISDVVESEPMHFPTSHLVHVEDNTEWSHHDLHPVEKIKAKVVERRMRCREHFLDFDPLRKGVCTVGQLKAVFTILNLAKDLSRAEFDKLTYGYMRDDGLFCYSQFCSDIDLAFTTPHLEKSPSKNISMPDATSTSPARRNVIKMSMEKKEAVEELEEKIRTRVRLRRVLIKPTFRDMDHAHKGFITRGQFARCMVMLGFALSEAQIDLLAGLYCTFGNHLDFNYIDFCKSVDQLDEEIEVALRQAQAPDMGKPPSRYFDAKGNVHHINSNAAVTAFG
mmetsp:Transcript_45087/g.97950  ORF Transcript_45087/g.97950 Transcript_45087/m.97950 type:complete len:495 (-) Transcript_45087:95-1579(-)|eukprot:CAMPEP_0170615210 /NCGR_PEP_ID=MMETSP0224-20130122/25216_1 /TAXON_ID=285029 /ORGANISM="Togula jolla, Strain CCCM 725" /LENGTH=494 /DNA_ID=CAMNT_0010940927 /DNA_START=34 /DNA_END=1518 /DNA_ORIENTATION=-